jgi:hypothetical protein
MESDSLLPLAPNTIEPASDAEMVRHLLEAKGVKPSPLSRDTMVPNSAVSEILEGKKPGEPQVDS